MTGSERRVDPVFLIEDVGEGRARSLELDLATRLELLAQFEQDPRYFGPAVEYHLDAGERATVIPESALLARAASGVPRCDQLDRAEGMVLGLAPVVHAAIVPPPTPCAIRRNSDSGAGSYGRAASGRHGRVVFCR